MTAPAKTATERLSALRETAHAKFFAAFAEASGTSLAPGDLVQSVTEMLVKERRELVLKMLGFRDTWGRVEVDRDRSGGTMLQSYLAQQCEVAVQAWLTEHVKPLFDKVAAKKLLTPAYKTALEKSFSEAFDSAIRDQAWRMGKEAGHAEGVKIRDEIMAAMSLKQE